MGEILKTSLNRKWVIKPEVGLICRLKFSLDQDDEVSAELMFENVNFRIYSAGTWCYWTGSVEAGVISGCVLSNFW